MSVPSPTADILPKGSPLALDAAPSRSAVSEGAAKGGLGSATVRRRVFGSPGSLRVGAGMVSQTATNVASRADTHRPCPGKRIAKATDAGNACR